MEILIALVVLWLVLGGGLLGHALYTQPKGAFRMDCREHGWHLLWMYPAGWLMAPVLMPYLRWKNYKQRQASAQEP